jgi:hypothetical protein
MRTDASGTLTFVLTLDKEAAQIVRSDAFDAQSLSDVFNTKRLKDAGFTVSTKDFQSKNSTLTISTHFADEKELRNALSVLAPPSAVTASFHSTKTLLKQKQSATLHIDISRLRDLYLTDPSTKQAVENAGIEYDEYRNLVSQAFSSTTLRIELTDGSSSSKKSIAGDSKKSESISLSSSSTRAAFLLNWMGAIIAMAIAVMLFYRSCRTPRLVSTSEHNQENK